MPREKKRELKNGNKKKNAVLRFITDWQMSRGPLKVGLHTCGLFGAP